MTQLNPFAPFGHPQPIKKNYFPNIDIMEGDKIKVRTKNGNKLCTIETIDFENNEIYFKGYRFGLTVNADRVRKLSTSWRGAIWEYYSFN